MRCIVVHRNAQRARADQRDVRNAEAGNRIVDDVLDTFFERMEVLVDLQRCQARAFACAPDARVAITNDHAGCSMFGWVLVPDRKQAERHTDRPEQNQDREHQRAARGRMLARMTHQQLVHHHRAKNVEAKPDRCHVISAPVRSLPWSQAGSCSSFPADASARTDAYCCSGSNSSIFSPGGCKDNLLDPIDDDILLRVVRILDANLFPHAENFVPPEQLRLRLLLLFLVRILDGDAVAEASGVCPLTRTGPARPNRSVSPVLLAAHAAPPAPDRAAADTPPAASESCRASRADRTSAVAAVVQK